MKRSLIGLSLMCVWLISSGAVCRGSGTQPAPFTLEYWTVYTSSEDIQPVIDAFAVKYPYISVEIKTFRQDEYEGKLIEAWAQGKGPDMFSVPNSHIGSFQNLISPMPSSLKLTSVTVTQSLGQKNTVVASEALKGTTAQDVNVLFPQVVYDDVVKSSATGTSQVYGLPLSMDTLVLYYNKTLLDAANIPQPATTWDDFVKQVPQLTLTDVNDNIIQAGAALGTSENVPRMFDIVSLLMMQNGATMSSGTNVTFAQGENRNDEVTPGVQAVDFYTSFANPAVDWYSWNKDQPDALEQFLAGKLVYYFGYYYNKDSMKNSGDQLDIGIAPVPQVTADPLTAINYANYWLESVSVNSAHPNESWAFIQALTTSETNVKAMLDKNPKPTALRSLLESQKDNFDLAVFANETLTAQSWYAGKKPAETEQAFADMIDIVNAGRLDILTAVENTASKVELTYE
ncbi:MAG: hypothetical protein WCV88_03850 [Patescibacteria group bacterium]